MIASTLESHRKQIEPVIGCVNDLVATLEGSIYRIVEIFHGCKLSRIAESRIFAIKTFANFGRQQICMGRKRRTRLNWRE